MHIQTLRVGNWSGSIPDQPDIPDTPPTTEDATITINGNGSSSPPREEHYRIGDRVTSFTYTMSRYGYARDGLWTEPEGGIQVDNQIEGYLITGDETWYYHWRPAQFTITFVYNRGMTRSEQKQITYLSQLGNLPEPTVNGYTLDGWFTASTGGEQISSSTQVTGNATYYGHWTLIENPITYNMNGHGTIPDGVLLVNSVEKNGDYTPPDPEPVEGWTFTGWEPSVLPLLNCEPFTFNANWRQNDPDIPDQPDVPVVVVKHTVTFNANGGTIGVPSVEVDHNSTLADIPTPTRTGHSFLGWYDQVEGGEQLTSQTPIVGDALYYAHWRINQYTATFDANGGTGGTSITQDYGTQLTAPDVSRDEYIFTGWSPTVPDTMPASNTTYSAQWRVKQYTVTFDANGGTGGWSRKMNFGQRLTAPTVAREGHEFSGWTPAVP